MENYYAVYKRSGETRKYGELYWAVPVDVEVQYENGFKASTTGFWYFETKERADDFKSAEITTGDKDRPSQTAPTVRQTLYRH
jgi:hypothetical protein